MNKVISLAIFAGGILLIIFGISATKSFSSDISQFFAGLPADKAIWMLVGGAVVAVIGLVELLRRSKGKLRVRPVLTAIPEQCR
jgi:hypothetical protein